MPGSSRGSCAVHRRHSSFLPPSCPRACLCSLVFQALHYKVNYDAEPVKPETSTALSAECRRSSWRTGPTAAPLLPATVLPRACLCSLCSQLCITKLLMMRPVKPETAQRCRRSSCRTGPTAAPLVLALHAWQARYNDRTQRCRANEDLLCNRRASCPSLNHSRQFRRVAGLGYRLLSAWSRVRVPPPAPDAGVAQG